MDADRAKLPEWHTPDNRHKPSKLKLYNTLTRSKVEFVPINGNRVTWYSCGPTVYDASHMGHARNYVTIDINRRIISDYFGYDIMFVQNVTNIDDKIIVRGRQNHLFKVFSEEALARSAQPDDALIQSIKACAKTYGGNYLPGSPVEEGVEALYKWADRIPAGAKAGEPRFDYFVESIADALKAIRDHATLSTQQVLEKSKAVIMFALDLEKGWYISDHKIFNDLSSYWEAEFDDDMRALNVLPPSVTTRVSEYVPEILEFIVKIVDNGFAYVTADGSVYFDTVKFEDDEHHTYTKLQPWNKGQEQLIGEGEGQLSRGFSGKKSTNDFALWKATKMGEPSWPSPWGKGRPGWHIECSVMASTILGNQIDIHSGGIDLAFPHHDNELAQSEAYSGECQWVNYFLHTGHLHIAGQKMSKSLKNFITIKESLKKYTARQLRLAFAMQQWNSQFDFKPELPEVKSLESQLNNFFIAVKALIREQESSENKKPGKLELELYKDLGVAQNAVHEALADNLSVPVAMSTISELVQKSNAYIASAKTDVKIEVLTEVVRYITKMLKIFGFETNSDGLGWTTSTANEQEGSLKKEDVAFPYVQVLSNFRDDVREKAIAKAPYKEFLEATDHIRDFELLELGVALDDRADERGALIKFIGEEEKQKLMDQRNDKEQRAREKEAKKTEQAKKEEAQRLERLEKARISPEEMFKNTAEGYSAFDASGIPTHDKEGQPLSKSLIKKLTKLHIAQSRLHDEYKQTAN